MSLTSKGADAVSAQSRAAEDAVKTPGRIAHDAYYGPSLSGIDLWSSTSQPVRDGWERVAAAIAALATPPSDPASVSGQPAPVVPDDREDVRSLAEAGLELAQLASYAEIVGGVSHNRGPIREACDEVFRLQRAYQKRLDAEEDALAATPSRRADDESSLKDTLTLIRDFAGSSALFRNDALDHIHGVASAALAGKLPQLPRRADTPLGSGDDGIHRCGICDQPLTAGQPVLTDVELGTVHAACCGPERESYVKDIDTGEPLAPDDPIPSGRPFEQDTPPGGGGVVDKVLEATAAMFCDSWVGDPASNPDFVRSLIELLRGVAAAPAAPEPAAGGEREIDEDDREIDRILAMSGDELQAELVAEGHDPDALIRQMKQGLDGTLRLAADRQRWREEAASWRRVAERLEEERRAILKVERERIAKIIDGDAFRAGDPNYYGPEWNRAVFSARQRVALYKADAILSTPSEAGAAGEGELPNIGTPVQAIEFAIKIDDHYDRLEFLTSWNEGDISEWPEFMESIAPPPTKPRADAPVGGA